MTLQTSPDAECREAFARLADEWSDLYRAAMRGSYDALRELNRKTEAIDRVLDEWLMHHMPQAAA